MRNLIYGAREAIRVIQPDRIRVKKLYRHYCGRELNLDDPKGLQQKVNWLKLYGMTPLHSFCADKITVPAYVASRIGSGHVVKRVFSTYDVADLRSDLIELPACMIKTNHDSGGIFKVPDVANADWTEIRMRVSKQIRRRFGRGLREKQYDSIRPGIVIEELLRPRHSSIISDFRIYCFNGVPNFIRVTKIDVSAPKRNTLLGATFDLEWNPLPFGFDTDVKADVPRPSELSLLIEQARRLAEPFALVRVDFLEAADQFVVGELTFSPNGGVKEFSPFSAELDLGAQLDHRAPTRDWRDYLDAAKAHLEHCVMIDDLRASGRLQ